MAIISEDAVNVFQLARLSTALGGRYGVRIEIDGDEAYTFRSRETGDFVIKLPAVSFKSDATAMLRGFIDHECGHVRFTDFDVIDCCPTGQVRHHVFNIFEDIRIERKMSHYYKGCRGHFDALERYFFTPKTYSKSLNSCDKRDAVGLSLLFLVHLCRMLHKTDKAEKKFLETIKNDIAKIFPSLSDVFLHFAEKSHTYETSQDCWDAAGEFIHAIAQKHKEEQEANGKDQDPDQDQDQSPAEAGQDEQHNLTKQQQFDMLELLDSYASGGRSYDPSDMIDVKEKFNRACTEGTKVKSKNGKIIRLMSTCCKYSYMQSTSPLTAGLIRAAGVVSSGITAKLNAALQYYMRERIRTERYGSLNKRKLALAPTGNRRIFLQVDRRRKINTEVCLLLDASGSMEQIVPAWGEVKTNMQAASVACYGLCRALNNFVGVRFSVYAFGDGDLLPLKNFDDKLQFRMPIARGGTATGRAMLSVLPRFNFADPDVKKIMIVLTDGCANDQIDFCTAVELCVTIGVHTHVFGIAPLQNWNIMPAGYEHLYKTAPTPKDIVKNLAELIADVSTI